MARKPITITAGRWVFTPTPREGTALIKAVSETTGSEVIIARVFAQPRKGEREMDAALMAAAPALLRACQAALGYLTSPSITDEQDALDKSHLLTLLATALFDASHTPEVPA